MKTKKVTRYYADGCNKGYWNKKDCINHESNCKCWTNPIHRTCKTCRHGTRVSNSNGMEDEPQFLDTWMEWDCSNDKFDYYKHFTPAHKTAEDLCINCPVWESYLTNQQG